MIQRTVFAGWLIPVLFLPGVVGAQSKAGVNTSVRKPALKAAAAAQTVKPSLDVLVSRANAYWNFLAQGKRLQALQYVEASCREEFEVRPFPSFSAPRIEKLEFGASGKEVMVTLTVKRALPPLAGEFDYPVANKWVFSEGTWRVIMTDDELPILAGKGSSGKVGAYGSALEKLKKDLRARLRFPKREIYIGTVRQGNPTEFALEYRLSGDRPVEMRLQDSSLEIQKFPAMTLQPGIGRRVQVSFLTDNYDGPVQGAFTISIKQGDAEVLYNFRLRGRVYTPLSIVPRALLYQPDETEKEVEIRNNTAHEVRFGPVVSQNRDIDAGPLPEVLAPGGRCTFKVRLLSKDAAASISGVLSIKLVEPVDGISIIVIPITKKADPPAEK